MVSVPMCKGFGSRVMEAMIRGQDGKVRFAWRAEGLVCARNRHSDVKSLSERAAFGRLLLMERLELAMSSSWSNETLGGSLPLPCRVSSGAIPFYAGISMQ